MWSEKKPTKPKKVELELYDGFSWFNSSGSKRLANPEKARTIFDGTEYSIAVNPLEVRVTFKSGSFQGARQSEMLAMSLCVYLRAQHMPESCILAVQRSLEIRASDLSRKVVVRANIPPAYQDKFDRYLKGYATLLGKN